MARLRPASIVLIQAMPGILRQYPNIKNMYWIKSYEKYSFFAVINAGRFNHKRILVPREITNIIVHLVLSISSLKTPIKVKYAGAQEKANVNIIKNCLTQIII